MIEFKFCEKCERPFDIGANLDVCPECRGKKIMEETIHGEDI